MKKSFYTLLITLFFLFGLLVFSLILPLRAGAGVEMDCDGTIKAWIEGGYYRHGECKCVDGQPVCSKSSSGGSLGGKKHNVNQEIKLQVMEAVVGAMFQSLFAAPDESKNDQLRQQQKMEQEMARIAEEQAKKKALHDWQIMQSEAERKRKLDQEAKIDQGKRLLSQMQTIGGDNKIEPFRAGNPKLDLKPIGQNTYPSIQYNDFERMMCSAYFSHLAKKNTNDVDMRFYADQAQRVMSGEPTYLECRIPQASSAVMAKRMDEIKKTYEYMNKINIKIQDIDTKLTETKEKITAAETKKEQTKTTISELQNRATSAAPEEKNEIDELLRQALNQSQELDQQILQEKQAEIDLQKEKEQAENEFDTMQTQLTNRQ